MIRGTFKNQNFQLELGQIKIRRKEAFIYKRTKIYNTYSLLGIIIDQYGSQCA